MPTRSFRDGSGVEVRDEDKSREELIRELEALRNRLDPSMAKTLETSHDLSEMGAQSENLSVIPDTLPGRGSHVDSEPCYRSHAEVQLDEEVAERKRVEKKLRESEETYRELVELLPQHVFEVNRSGVFTFSNRIGTANLGYTPEELVGRETMLKVLAPHLHESAVDDFKRLAKGEKLTEVDYTLVKRDGSTFDVVTHITPIMRDGTFCGARGVAVDISEMKRSGEALKRAHDELETRVAERTKDLLFANEQLQREIMERKQTENELSESESRFRSFLENLGDVAYETDVHGRLTYVNRMAAEIIDIPVKELIGTPFLPLFSDESQEAVLKAYSEILNGKSIEVELALRNGTILHLKGEPRMNREGQTVGVSGIARDVTEMRRAEKDRLRLATAIEQADELIIITDTDGTIQYCNPAFEQKTGFTRDEAMGRNPRILKSGRHGKAFYEDLWQTISKGRVWKGRLMNRRKKGEVYEEDATISPIKDGTGHIVGYVAVKRDVTHELALERRLVQTQKIEAIGTLAGGIAHDFNNILYAIMGFSELAIEDSPERSPVNEYLEQVLAAAERAKYLVNQILTFSRQTEQEKKPIQLAPIVKEVCKFLRASLPTTIAIRNDIGDNLGPILGDPTQIHQVLMNLCTNAGHAMREKGGELVVALHDVELDTASAEGHPDVVPGKYQRLAVRDTGTGIDPAVLDRIFDPYFTTKQKVEGTGLGLAVVHGIMKGHSGLIEVQSEPGKGTVFQAYFPVVHVDPSPRAVSTKPVPTGKERILLIDDEDSIIQMVKVMLERLGYSVVARTSSIEALELFRAKPGEFDLVITDMTMPNMTGKELAQKLIAIRRDIAVILCTGFSELITDEQARAMGIRALVMKPILKAEIGATIRRVIDSPEKLT
jgi:PAS domain S-box-containing protein